MDVFELLVPFLVFWAGLIVPLAAWQVGASALEKSGR